MNNIHSHFLVLLSALASLCVCFTDARAEDACELVAHISVEAVKGGAFNACRKGALLGCVVAAVADVTSDDAKAGTAEGCKYVVTTFTINSKQHKRISITSEKYAGAIREAYEELLEVHELRWIRRQLGGR